MGIIHVTAPLLTMKIAWSDLNPTLKNCTSTCAVINEELCLSRSRTSNYPAVSGLPKVKVYQKVKDKETLSALCCYLSHTGTMFLLLLYMCISHCSDVPKTQQKVFTGKFRNVAIHNEGSALWLLCPAWGIFDCPSMKSIKGGTNAPTAADARAVTTHLATSHARD